MTDPSTPDSELGSVVPPDASPPDTSGRPEAKKKRTLLRLGVLALIIVGIFVAARVSGVTDDLSAEKVRDVIQGSGISGMLLYIVIFCVGELAQLPGWIFIVSALLAWGQLNGFLLAYIGAIASTVVGFVVVRAVGGHALTELKWGFARKVLSRVELQPIRIIALLRLVLWVAPPLTAALALTRVRFRDYLIGTALGLVIPIALIALLFEPVLAWWSSTPAA